MRPWIPSNGFSTQQLPAFFVLPKQFLQRPTEKRTKALDAAADGYRQTAQDLGCDEAEIQELLDVIMFRLRTEVAARELAQQKNERHDNDAASLVPGSAPQKQ